jgi:hypothetical protein
MGQKTGAAVAAAVGVTDDLASGRSAAQRSIFLMWTRRYVMHRMVIAGLPVLNPCVTEAARVRDGSASNLGWRHVDSNRTARSR